MPVTRSAEATDEGHAMTPDTTPTQRDPVTRIVVVFTVLATCWFGTLLISGWLAVGVAALIIGWVVGAFARHIKAPMLLAVFIGACAAGGAGRWLLLILAWV